MRAVLLALIISSPLSLSSVAPEIKSTTRIIVSAKNLARPIEITDGAVLALSHVFAGNFMNRLAAPPDASLPRYTVTFDIQTIQGVKEAAYVVVYSVDPITRNGFVYLPGPGEESHRRNISTILREGHDGYWHYASDEWSAAINRYLER